MRKGGWAVPGMPESVTPDHLPTHERAWKAMYKAMYKAVYNAMCDIRQRHVRHLAATAGPARAAATAGPVEPT